VLAEADAEADALADGELVDAGLEGIGDGAESPDVASSMGTATVTSPVCWNVSVTVTVWPTRTRPLIPVSSGTEPSPSL
jgi:hypothetical protein